MVTRSNILRRRPRGFTLTELLVAIGVLIVVLLAAGKIFSTTQQVASLGEANADVLQEVAAIEAQLREDFRNLSRDGFFAIQCVAVPNDVRGAGQPLIDPNRPDDAVIRADQLVFFRTGLQTPRTLSPEAGEKVRASGTVSRVYYGPAFQLGPGTAPAATVNANPVRIEANDPTVLLAPWETGVVDMTERRYVKSNQNFTTGGASPPTHRVPPIPSQQWLFVRNAMVLADDNGPVESGAPVANFNRTIYLDDPDFDHGGQLTAYTPFIQDAWPGLGTRLEAGLGRLDAAAGSLVRVRRSLTLIDPSDVTSASLLWNAGGGDDQMTRLIDGAFFYPRAERYAPSMNRLDQALTNGVLGSGVSSCRIEWTWEDGTGAVVNPETGVLEWAGFSVLDPVEFGSRPWFGLFSRLDQFLEADRVTLGDTLFLDNIERTTGFNGVDPGFYQAVFGYNQSEAVGPLAGGGVGPFPDLGYTPWPTAIRVTLTLHDPRGRLDEGRTVQFVIDLPRDRSS